MEVDCLVADKQLIVRCGGQLDFRFHSFVADEANGVFDVLEDEVWYRRQNHVDEEDGLQTDLRISFFVHFAKQVVHRF